MSILLGKELIALSICVLTALGLLLIAVGYYGRAKLKKTAAPKKESPANTFRCFSVFLNRELRNLFF